MDEDTLAEASRLLLDAVAASLPAWIERQMLALAPGLRDEAAAAARRVTDEVIPQLRTLLATDIDQQRATPLQLVRDAVAVPTAVLAAAGVPPARRDPWQVEADPDDVYGLSPARWADVGDDVGQAGLVWGAAKAMVHLRRHRPENPAAT